MKQTASLATLVTGDAALIGMSSIWQLHNAAMLALSAGLGSSYPARQGRANKHGSRAEHAWVQAEVESKPNLWGNFMTVSGDDVPLYASVPGYDQLRTSLTQKLGEYNESNAAMDLVLFQQASPSNPLDHPISACLPACSMVLLAEHLCA